MSAKLQLKIFVLIYVIFVVIVWIYVDKQNSDEEGFLFGKDFNNLKRIIKDGINSIPNSLSKQDVDDVDLIESEIDVEKSNSVEGRITEKFLNKLSKKETILYEYEPWRIRFDYDINMNKDLNDEEILLYYEDIPGINVRITKEVLENKSFNDWLNNNYDLQELNKASYGDLIFWSIDISNDDVKKEDYFLNIDDIIYSFHLNCDNDNIENYWDSLLFIIKSFNIY